MEPDRLVVLPEDINLSVAAFTEIVSVSYHAIQRFLRFSHERRNVIGVWGDGNLGYITSLLLKKLLPDTKVCVFGVNEYKLNDFSFVDDTYLVTDIPEDLHLDHAFECVGGAAASKAINQIIVISIPEGTISIMGVSDVLHRLIHEWSLRRDCGFRQQPKRTCRFPGVDQFVQGTSGGCQSSGKDCGCRDQSQKYCRYDKGI